MGGLLGRKTLSNCPNKDIFEGHALRLKKTLRHRIARAMKNLNEHADQEKQLKEYFLGTVSVDMIIEYFLSFDQDRENLSSRVSTLETIYKKIFGEDYIYKEEDQEIFKLK